MNRRDIIKSLFAAGVAVALPTSAWESPTAYIVSFQCSKHSMILDRNGHIIVIGENTEKEPDLRIPSRHHFDGGGVKNENFDSYTRWYNETFKDPEIRWDEASLIQDNVLCVKGTPKE